MEIKEIKMMKVKRSVYALAGTASLAVFALGASTTALAGGVYWSVGLSSPGVQLGVFNPQPVYVQPQAVYVQPQPYYAQPRPVYVQPQVVYTQPRPVYVQARPDCVQPQVVYDGWNHPRHGWHHGPQRYPTQVVQSYPVQYQLPAPYYGGHGYEQR